MHYYEDPGFQYVLAYAERLLRRLAEDQLSTNSIEKKIENDGNYLLKLNCSTHEDSPVVLGMLFTRDDEYNRHHVAAIFHSQKHLAMARQFAFQDNDLIAAVNTAAKHLADNLENLGLYSRIDLFTSNSLGT